MTALQVLSSVALLSFKAARVPRDKEHPYGCLSFLPTFMSVSFFVMGHYGFFKFHICIFCTHLYYDLDGNLFSFTTSEFLVASSWLSKFTQRCLNEVVDSFKRICKVHMNFLFYTTFCMR